MLVLTASANVQIIGFADDQTYFFVFANKHPEKGRGFIVYFPHRPVEARTGYSKGCPELIVTDQNGRTLRFTALPNRTANGNLTGGVKVGLDLSKDYVLTRSDLDLCPQSIRAALKALGGVPPCNSPHYYLYSPRVRRTTVI